VKEHRRMRAKSNIVPPDEFASTVVRTINESAVGLRGRKRREFIGWARKWWIDQLRKKSKET